MEIIEEVGLLNRTYPTTQFSYNWYDWTSAILYLGVAALWVYLFIRYYTKKRPLDWGTFISLCITCFFLFYMILLLTVDIAAGWNLCEDQKGGNEDISCMYMIPLVFTVIYSILYWSIFLLSWIILPYYQSWVENGDFYFLRKIWGSFVDNIISYLIYFAVLGGLGIIVIAYLLIYNAFLPKELRVVLNFEVLLGLGMSASNAFGLVLLTFLVGHSISAFPKYLWFQANDRRTLNYYQFQAVKITESIDTAKDNLLIQLGELKKIENIISREPELVPYFEILKKLASEVKEEYQKTLKMTDTPMEKVTYQTLADTHRNFNKALRSMQALENQWVDLQNKAFFLEDIIASKDNPESKLVSPLFKKFSQKYYDTIEFIYYTKVRVYLYRAIAIFSILFSVCLLWSYTTPFWKGVLGDVIGKKFSIFWLISQLLNMTPLSRVLIQLFALFSLGMITWMCFFSLFQLKIPSLMILVPYTTDASSILFLSILLCRVVPTICYTFVNMMGLTVDDGIAFSKVMGTLKTDSLKIFGKIGDLFGNYFPLVTIIITIIELFDILPRLLALVNYQSFIFTGFSDPGMDENVQYGKELLDIERRKRMREDFDENNEKEKEITIDEKQKKREEKTRTGKKMKEKREEEEQRLKIEDSNTIKIEDLGIDSEQFNF